jgi:hypothetical protein
MPYYDETGCPLLQDFLDNSNTPKKLKIKFLTPVISWLPKTGDQSNSEHALCIEEKRI